jgi:murein DD-endopeptidase MepM/ murein hydrolase activator NlpD
MDPIASMQFVSPVEPLVVSSRYGPRPRLLADGVTPGPLHPGLDLQAGYRQVVRAVAAGVVLRSYLSSNYKLAVPVGEDGKPIPGAKEQLVLYAWRPGDPKPASMGYGENVLLVHAGGLQTRYAHLAERLVQEGEHVDAGQPIGLAGTTGYSYGVHVHWEVKSDGGRSFLDPLPLIAHLKPAVF